MQSCHRALPHAAEVSRTGLTSCCHQDRLNFLPQPHTSCGPQSVESRFASGSSPPSLGFPYPRLPPAAWLKLLSSVETQPHWGSACHTPPTLVRPGPGSPFGGKPSDRQTDSGVSLHTDQVTGSSTGFLPGAPHLFQSKPQPEWKDKAGPG